MKTTAAKKAKIRSWKSKMRGFIKDEYAARKHKNRIRFFNLVKQGLAKPTDASLFHGLAAEMTVMYRSEEY